MKQLAFHRYMSNAERLTVATTGVIRSKSGITYFAVDPPSLYESRVDARRLLALPFPCEVRLGPLPEDEMPEMDHLPPSVVQPLQLPNGVWLPGGGREAATTQVTQILFPTRLV